MVAATIMQRSGVYTVRVIDAVTEGMLPDELLQYIRQIPYDSLILKTTAAGFQCDLELVRRIKEYKKNEILLAGPAAGWMKDYVHKTTEVDRVIEEPLDTYAYRVVHGRKGSINDMPAPDYSLVDYRKYTDDNNRIRLTLYTSKGCPMSCAYCPYVRYYPELEYRDIDRVMEDLRYAASLGADVIQFRDQFFTFNKDRIRQLCKRIISEKLNIRWICETRIDSLDEELVSLMKQAGMFLICFGIETGNANVLNRYNSKKGDLLSQKKMVDYINAQGILTMAFYIVGFPEDTFETAWETYRYAEEISSTIAAFNEYMDLAPADLHDMTPEVFPCFENAVNTGIAYRMTRREISYAARLFRTMYTAGHDSLEKAYHYNYILEESHKRKIRLLAEHKNDLEGLSDALRSADPG